MARKRKPIGAMTSRFEVIGTRERRWTNLESDRYLTQSARKPRVIHSMGHRLIVIGHEGRNTVLGTVVGKKLEIGMVPTKNLPRRRR